MNLISFFPAEFVVNKVITNDSKVTIEITSSKNSCKCLNCLTESTKIHSKYTRFLTDLSVIDRTLNIYLISRKFFCHNLLCSRKIFTERFDSLINPYAHRTDRSNERLKKLAFSISSEAASRISQYIYIRRTEPRYSSVKYRGSALDKHLLTIEKSLEDGAKSKDILNLIRNEGYNGSESSLRMLLSKMNKNKKLQEYNYNIDVINTTKTTKKLIKREKTEKLFWTSYTYLKEKDQEVLNEIISSSQELSIVYQAVQSFRAIFETKEIESLNMWIQNNSFSEIQHIKKFAQKLKKDFAAVSNSIKYDYTNGLIEGQVNRLKTIKRMMYGRANFDLLKKRVLYQF